MGLPGADRLSAGYIDRSVLEHRGSAGQAQAPEGVTREGCPSSERLAIDLGGIEQLVGVDECQLRLATLAGDGAVEA